MLSRRRFDVNDYYRMAEAGILGAADRVELIDGEIVQMSAIGSRHAACVASLHEALLLRLHGRAIVSSQGAVRLGRYTEPQPDLLVLRPRGDRYASSHPGPEDVLLLVEVADSSLPFDRDVKLPLFAAAGVPEVWIVDLRNDVAEIHRDPRDGSYAFRKSVLPGEPLTPESFPEFEIPLADVLPGAE